MSWRRHCSVSLTEEPHLLLELDEIMPVSKGGLSTPENLQTMCWKCNRTKSNKVLPI
ncbi:HNH endonuclease [Citricoccus zhacaiensis]